MHAQRQRDGRLSTHLPFLEEAVEIGVPDLGWSEFEKG